VKVPEKLNDAQRKALSAFQEAMGEVEPAKTEGEDGKEESGKKKSFWKK
jgi:molecular chaperone DnaJ